MRRCLSILLAGSMVLTGFGSYLWPAKISCASTSNEVKIITQVPQVNDSGRIYYTYQTEDGQDYQINKNSETASQNDQAGGALTNITQLRKEGTLPTKYDPRQTDLETPIRFQTDTGACWTFAIMKSLEGDAISKGLYSASEADFSENHLAYYTYNRMIEDSSHPLYHDGLTLYQEGIGLASDSLVSDKALYRMGGNAIMGTYILANGWGAVLEEKAPFDTINNMLSQMSTADSSLRFDCDYRLTQSNCLDNTSISDVKQKVLEQNAVDVSVYYDDDYLYKSSTTESYYQTTYGALYANHCVTIVGWDDSFSAFNPDKSPSKNGAWLIANSYGTSKNENGYFWLSYYDPSICDLYAFEGTTNDTYDSCYQYDGFGWGKAFVSNQSITQANVFVNENDTPQQIQAVAFYTLDQNQKYEISVYRNMGTKSATDGEEVEACYTTGTQAYSGFHTVTLKQPIIVAPGERFSIHVTFVAEDGEETYAAYEGDDTICDYGDDIYGILSYHSNSGESYVYFSEEKKWYSMQSVQANGTKVNCNNACLKAFAKNVSQEAYDQQENPSSTATATGTQIPGAIATATATPEVTKTPEVTTTDAPDSAKTPEVTKTPEATTTDAPDSTKTPEVTTTDAPDSTKTPEATTTDAPDSTKTPEATTTDTPDSTKTPEVTTTDTPPSTQVPNVSLLVKKITIGIGEKVNIPRKNSSFDKLTFQSKNKKIAKVSKKGIVQGRKSGKTTIQIRSEKTGKSLLLKVVVKKKPTKIKITAKKKVLKVGKKQKLKVFLSKKSASYHLSFSSSRKKIATVSSKGIVTAKKPGMVKITVRTYNKKKSFLKIKVIA